MIRYSKTNLFIQVDRAHDLFAVGTRKTPEVILVKPPRRAGNEWNQIQTLITKSKKQISSIPKQDTCRGSPAHARRLHLHLISRRDIRPLTTDAELSNILAAQRLAHIIEMHGIGLLRSVVRVCGRVHGEMLVMA